MSNFVVSARKYRPVRFDEVVGQQHVSETLKNALRQDRLAHAFLFCGPRGVGKTTNARILAKVLNCLNVGDDYEPCNECANCVAFNQNASFNIFELDGASNNKVDHMHQLMEQVRVPPQSGRKKVYIIDEVHMLSPSAFNAFLKTLEEPPDYAVFILATTEKHKILPTILSRCQVYDFHRIRPADMVAHLQQICVEEGLTAEPEALHLIAEKADGALRDALSIFDRVVSSSADKDLSYAHTAEQLNVLDHSTFFTVTDALLAEDAAGLYVQFDQVLANGFEPEPFLTGLAGHLRQLFVCKSPRTLGLIEVSDALRERYAQQASRCGPSFLINALNLAAECDFRLRQATNKRLHVELYLIKMAYAQRTVSREDISVPAEKKSPEQPLNPKPQTRAGTDTEAEASSLDLAKAQRSRFNGPPQENQPIKQKQPPKEAEQPPQEEAPQPRSKKSLAGLTPSISFEEEDDEEDDTIPASDLTLGGLKKVWLSHAEGLSARVRTTMKGAVLHFDCPTLTVRVGSVFAQNLLREQSKELVAIKEHLKCPGLNILVELDQALAPKEAPKKELLTAREQYQALLDTNPAVDDLRKQFGLEYEE